MTVLDYLQRTLSDAKRSERNDIELAIDVTLTGEVKSITDQLSESIRFDDETYYRLLSKAEVLDCGIDMAITFVEYKIFPLFDLGDNDYICYNYENRHWCKFNIIDEVIFAEKSSIIDYME